MDLIIDASNIIGGGGLTHLKELIRNAEPWNYGFGEVIVWAPDNTLSQLDDKPWLTKHSHTYLNNGYLYRLLWKYFVLKPSLNESSIVFMPGGGYITGMQKVVTMCQNLLPLDKSELDRYLFSFKWLRLTFLRYFHHRAFKKSEGVIFLNNYSYSALSDEIKTKINSYSIIPHGVKESFFSKKESYGFEKKFTLLNVSSVCLYKHQWVLAEAVLRLKVKGYNDIELKLIGKPKYGMDKLNKVLKRQGDDLNVIDYLGIVPYKELTEYYQNADAFLYSSTCETFGMTLLEAMANSLPIACSNKSSMSEMLQEAGTYYNPESVEETMDVILNLYNDKNLRRKKGERAFETAQNYSWSTTADQTLNYLKDIADSN